MGGVSILSTRSKEAGTGSMSLPQPSRKRKPSAAAIPQPASLVAIPPRQIMIFSAPSRTALAMTSPTPALLAVRGSRSAVGNSANPATRAVSIHPVLRPRCHSQRTGCVRPRAFRAAVSIHSPPRLACRTSREPSPPSAKGCRAISDSGHTPHHPRAMMAAASAAPRDPLNLSGAKRTRKEMDSGDLMATRGTCGLCGLRD